MSGAGNLDWVFQVVGWTLAAAGVVLLVWALFWDRSRGRRRCPKCWYDMGGVPGLRCPECGREHRHERRLTKTRRPLRWILAAAAVGLAGLCTAMVPAFQRGWTTVIPAWVLVNIADPTENFYQSLPLSGVTFTGKPPRLTIGGAIAKEAWERMADGRLRGWAARRLVRRFMAAANWEPGQIIRLPDAWPVGRPLEYLVARPVFPFSGFVAADVRVVGETRWPTVGSASKWSRCNAQLAPAAPIDSIEVDVLLRRTSAPLPFGAAPTGGLRGPSIPAEILYGTRLTIPIRIRGEPGNFLDRVDSAASGALVRRVLDPRLMRTADGEMRVVINDTSTTDAWCEIDFGVRFRAEVLVGTEVVATGEGNTTWARAVWKDWEEVQIVWAAGGRERLEAALLNEAGAVRIRLTGSVRAACDEYLEEPFDKPRAACWAGMVEVPARFTEAGSTPGGAP